ncbi:114_t:CDS:2, partial [Acaulospora colombiana]
DRIPIDEYPQAYALVLATVAHAKLLFADVLGSRADLEEAGKLLEGVDGVDKSVNAAFYEVKADYHKLKGEYAPYYRHSLLYLACVDIDTDLSSKQRFERAKDLSLSAFLSDSIYNFGELPILQQSYPFLRQKICLMALIEAVFRRKSSERTLSFQTIAEETQTPLVEVEHLVMKALSLKLIAGTIDEPAAKVHITWVQPRVLSRHQIETLSSTLGDWLEKMSKLENFVRMNESMCGIDSSLDGPRIESVTAVPVSYLDMPSPSLRLSFSATNPSRYLLRMFRCLARIMSGSVVITSRVDCVHHVVSCPLLALNGPKWHRRKEFELCRVPAPEFFDSTFIVPTFHSSLPSRPNPPDDSEISFALFAGSVFLVPTVFAGAAHSPISQAHDRWRPQRRSSTIAERPEADYSRL